MITERQMSRRRACFWTPPRVSGIGAISPHGDLLHPPGRGVGAPRPLLRPPAGGRGRGAPPPRGGPPPPPLGPFREPVVAEYAVALRVSGVLLRQLHRFHREGA